MDFLTRITLTNVRIGRFLDHAPLLSIDRLQLDGGVLYGVAGPNLSGKSALLRRIGGGLLTQSAGSDAGTCSAEGKAPLRCCLFEPSIHSVYLGPNPRDNLSSLTASVREELELHRQLASAGRDCISEKELMRLVSTFHLESVLDQNPIALSGGQTAAVALISARLMDRPVLCIDETLAHLDVELRYKAWEIVAELSRQGGLVLITENNYDLMAEHADRVILIDEGRVEAIEPTAVAFNSRFSRHRGIIPTPTRLAQAILPLNEQLPTRYSEIHGILAASLRGLDRDANAEGQQYFDVEPENDGRLKSPAGTAFVRSPAPVGESDLSFQDLEFAYPGSVGKCALKSASGHLPAGSTVGLIGANGAGKSTICKILNGLLKPGKGVIRLGDEIIVPSRRPGHYLAYSFQDPDDQIFLPSVVKELKFGPRNLGMTESDVEAAARWAMDLFGITDLADAHPLDLPFVLRKRICMAAAVAMQRPWTVFDEPTLGQDSTYCDRLLTIKDEIEKTGRGLIIISHDPEFTIEACEYFVVMDSGRCKWFGNREEILTGDGCRAASDFINMPGRLLRELALPTNCPTRLGLAKCFEQ